VEPRTVEEVLALLKERPRDAELYQLLGGLYFKRRDLRAAWQAYMQALRLDPDDPFTCLFFGNLLTLCDDKSYAEELYERAAWLAPDLAVVHWCRADLHRAQGEYELAGRAYERAVAVAPDDEQAREKLSQWRAFIAGAGAPDIVGPAAAEPVDAADPPAAGR
jgi:tetratricopeptide (TPR) repeat protein